MTETRIDWTRVWQLQADLGAGEFAELVELFREETDAHLVVLRGSPGTEEMADALHALKGCALNLGFGGVAEICGAAERAVPREGTAAADPRAIATLMDRSFRELERKAAA
ncbi:Hpt domain-containing protein [Rhodobacteraceae bacterium CCMM004]|nr:Hpt domain-containing protein [Rhodobacteraceae bacterium CCMM004]